jgi:hypothetical protein
MQRRFAATPCIGDATTGGGGSIVRRRSRERRNGPHRFTSSTRHATRHNGEIQEVPMGYERNDRGGTGGDRGRYGDDRGRSYGDYGNYGGGSGTRDYRGERFNSSDRDRWQSDRGDYGRNPQGYDYQDRGFFDRAGDEVRSWFGDGDAERRRRMDDRNDQRSGNNWDRGGDAGGWQSSQSQGGYRSRHENDPHYRTWRDKQMESLDRDYDEYRRENQGRFDNEFGSWRDTRQGQRGLLQKVQEHQEVVGSDGQHVGTVDHVRGDRILLTKNDQAAGGHHHSIPSSWIQSVDDKVTVSKTAEQAKQHWRDEQRNNDGGLFGRDEDRSTNLNRSFSGTY